ncbi:MAG: ribosome silencing factor [Clostridia bacterium]|nr:ribosome silencing factor [Clostridia bacterium]
MTSKETAFKIAEILDSKKAKGIKVLKVADLTSIADYFVICTGTSSTHIKSLSSEVEFQLEQADIRPLHNEGVTSASWILKDYNTVVVHLFTPEADEFYRLEHMWADATDMGFEETED